MADCSGMLKEEGGDETGKQGEKDRDGKIEKQSTGPTGFYEWHRNVFSNMIDIAGSRFLRGRGLTSVGNEMFSGGLGLNGLRIWISKSYCQSKKREYINNTVYYIQ